MTTRSKIFPTWWSFSCMKRMDEFFQWKKETNYMHLKSLKKYEPEKTVKLIKYPNTPEMNVSIIFERMQGISKPKLPHHLLYCSKWNSVRICSWICAMLWKVEDRDFNISFDQLAPRCFRRSKWQCLVCSTFIHSYIS